MRVISNTAVSMDGRIGTTGGHSFNVGSDEDRRRMGLLRAKADAVLVGGRTFRVGPQLIAEPIELRRPGVRRPLVNAVLTRVGVAPFIGDEWQHSEAVLHVFGPDLDRDAHESRGAKVHAAEDPAAVLDALEGMGCKLVLVEGGGDLIFQLVARDRIDSVFLTLAPRIIGGVGAPSLADGEGFSPQSIRNFALVDMERVGDELFLRYDKKA